MNQLGMSNPSTPNPNPVAVSSSLTFVTFFGIAISVFMRMEMTPASHPAMAGGENRDILVTTGDGTEPKTMTVGEPAETRARNTDSWAHIPMWTEANYLLTPNLQIVTYERNPQHYGSIFQDDKGRVLIAEEVDLEQARCEFCGETEGLRLELHEMMLDLPRLITMTIQHELRGWVLGGMGRPD
ncbi:UNVERIFIED_CONTAM: hypothetical protein K2H54_027655 [Gekko kuhli]